MNFIFAASLKKRQGPLGPTSVARYDQKSDFKEMQNIRGYEYYDGGGYYFYLSRYCNQDRYCMDRQVVNGSCLLTNKNPLTLNSSGFLTANILFGATEVDYARSAYGFGNPHLFDIVLTYDLVDENGKVIKRKSAVESIHSDSLNMNIIRDSEKYPGWVEKVNFLHTTLHQKIQAPWIENGAKNIHLSICNNSADYFYINAIEFETNAAVKQDDNEFDSFEEEF